VPGVAPAPPEAETLAPAPPPPEPDATGADVATGEVAGVGAPPAGVHNELAPEPTAEPSAPEPPVAPAAPPAAPPAVPPAVPPVVDVDDLDWEAVRVAVDPGAVRARIRATVERLEALLDQEDGPGMLFDADRAGPHDRAIHALALTPDAPVWFVGDLHGDLLALEAALALVRGTSGTEADADSGLPPRLVLLGDLFDDGGYGIEVLLRVFELVCDRPDSVCVVAGNHDEALAFDGARFRSSVVPSDFADFLNAHLAHEWVVRAGKLAVRLFASAPRALFFPDGLLVAHGGFPLADLHAELAERGDWNDPRCLSDFVWTRAHPRARKKIPNRVSRGSQFGYEDFAAFCALSAGLGRPVTCMVRGHDHVEERYAVYPAYAAHPLLTTVALSRRLPREAFGPYERVPTVARWVPGALPQVFRLHLPGALVRETYPEPEGDAPADDARADPGAGG